MPKIDLPLQCPVAGPMKNSDVGSLEGCQSLRKIFILIRSKVSLRPLAGKTKKLPGTRTLKVHPYGFQTCSSTVWTCLNWLTLKFSDFSGKSICKKYQKSCIFSAQNRVQSYRNPLWTSLGSLSYWWHASLQGEGKESVPLAFLFSQRPWPSALHSKIWKLIQVPNNLSHKPHAPVSGAW